MGWESLFEGENLRLHRRVAVKVLPRPFGAEATEWVKRFQRESSSTNRNVMMPPCPTCGPGPAISPAPSNIFSPEQAAGGPAMLTSGWPEWANSGIGNERATSSGMRLHNEGTNRSRSVLDDTSHAVVNPAFSRDENIDAALRTEHAAIACGLEALYQAVLSGAKLEVVSDVVWTVQNSCIARFVAAEQILRDSGFGGLKAYTAVRRRFLRSLSAAHRAVREGKVEATLDIADVLGGFLEHIEQLLNPNLAQQQGVRHAGAIQ